jgi:hypothetical protein
MIGSTEAEPAPNRGGKGLGWHESQPTGIHRFRLAPVWGSWAGTSRNPLESNASDSRQLGGSYPKQRLTYKTYTHLG